MGRLDFAVDTAASDLWCPDGMVKHDLTQLRAFESLAQDHAAGR